MYIRRNGEHDNVQTTTINNYYEASISAYFAPADKMTQLLAVTVGQIVTERNVSLLFSDDLQ
jgi:hypothetical protein